MVGKQNNEHSIVEKPVLLFDGVCNLCNGTVRFIIPRDPEGHFLFASLQSEAGQALLKKFQLNTDNFDTFILIDRDRYYERSTAVLKVAKQLKGMWSWLYYLIILPRPLRDFIYNLVAKTVIDYWVKRILV